jgi:hypothetical protein
MAFTATHNAPSAHHSLIARSIATIGKYLLGYAEARSHYAEIERLRRLSDADLAKLGLSRDGIVRHVFSDSFYL